MFQLNQTVFDIAAGEGCVVALSFHEKYPVKVRFDIQGVIYYHTYTKDGRIHTLSNQQLFTYPVEIVRREVSFKDLPIDTKIMFNGKWPRHYAGNFNYYAKGTTSYTTTCSPLDFNECDNILLGETVALNGITYAEGTQIWPE